MEGRAATYVCDAPVPGRAFACQVTVTQAEGLLLLLNGDDMVPSQSNVSGTRNSYTHMVLASLARGAGACRIEGLGVGGEHATPSASGSGELDINRPLGTLSEVTLITTAWDKPATARSPAASTARDYR